MNCIESLAEVDECKDAGQVVSSDSLYQPAKRDDLSNGGPLLSEAIQSVQDHAVIQLHDRRHSADVM